MRYDSQHQPFSGPTTEDEAVVLVRPARDPGGDPGGRDDSTSAHSRCNTRGLRRESGIRTVHHTGAGKLRNTRRRSPRSVLRKSRTIVLVGLLPLAHLLLRSASRINGDDEMI